MSNSRKWDFCAFRQKICGSLVLLNPLVKVLSTLGDAHEETTIHARIFGTTYTSPHFDDRSIFEPAIVFFFSEERFICLGTIRNDLPVKIPHERNFGNLQ